MGPRGLEETTIDLEPFKKKISRGAAMRWLFHTVERCEVGILLVGLVLLVPALLGIAWYSTLVHDDLRDFDDEF